MGLIAGYQTPPDLNSPTTIEAEATAVQRQFEQEVRAIRANTLISTAGKRIAIAALFAPAAEKVAALQRQERESYAAAVARLERQLYGTVNTDDSASVISTRDAFSRIESIADDNPPSGPVSAEKLAARLLDRATKSGDQPLVRATIATAMARGWHELLSTFVSANSDLADAVSDMIELRKWDPSVTLMAYYTFQFKAPSEIAGATSEQARQIAAEGETTPSSANFVPQPTGPEPYTGEIPSWLRPGFRRLNS